MTGTPIDTIAEIVGGITGEQVKKVLDIAHAGIALRNTCYLERSAVRAILIGQSDENLHVTEEVLQEIDALPIYTLGDIIKR